MLNLKKLVLVGGGGFSSEIAEVAEMTGFSVIGYFGDEQTNSTLKYFGKLDDNLNDPDFEYIFPAYGAVDRLGIEKRSQNLEVISRFLVPSLISPKAQISKSAVIAEGVYIAHGAIVNPNADIGKFCIINSNSTIGHNVRIGKNTIISGNVFIGGGCSIGDSSLVGPGVTTLHSIKIGSRVIISLGSVIVRSVPDGKTSVPMPSKIF